MRQIWKVFGFNTETNESSSIKDYQSTTEKPVSNSYISSIFEEMLPPENNLQTVITNTTTSAIDELGNEYKLKLNHQDLDIDDIITRYKHDEDFP